MVNNTESIVMPWYKSVVESHLECCMCFWLPSLKKDTAEVGRIRRKAMQMIKGLETSYTIIREDEKNLLCFWKEQTVSDKWTLWWSMEKANKDFPSPCLMTQEQGH